MASTMKMTLLIGVRIVLNYVIELLVRDSFSWFDEVVLSLTISNRISLQRTLKGRQSYNISMKGKQLSLLLLPN